MVGFAIYTYEGIGIIMPVMETCKYPEKFPKILFAAIFTLSCLYIAFAELCYIAYGENMVESIMLMQLNPANHVIQVIKVLYILNLVCGYPLVMFPVNLICEQFVYGKKH